MIGGGAPHRAQARDNYVKITGHAA
jgi:hypothetical protein